MVDGVAWVHCPRALSYIGEVAPNVLEVRDNSPGSTPDARFLVHSELGDSAGLRAEAQAWKAASERDSRVLPLVDWGEDEKGNFYFLTRYARKLVVPMTERLALRAARCMAGAVARMGVHGNITSTTVYTGLNGGVLLGGWGIQRLERSGADRDDAHDVARLFYFMISGHEHTSDNLSFNSSVSSPLRKLLRNILEDLQQISLVELRYDLAAAAGQLPECTRALPPTRARRKETHLKADLNSVNGSISRAAGGILSTSQAPRAQPPKNSANSPTTTVTHAPRACVVRPVNVTSVLPSTAAKPSSLFPTAALGDPVPESLSSNVEDIVSNLLDPNLIASDADKLTSVSAQTFVHPALVETVFKTLFKRPLGKNPIVCLKGLHLLHLLQRDGSEFFVAHSVQHDGFLDWLESMWTRERIQSRPAHKAHRLSHCFAVGELAWYAAFLRRRTAFFTAHRTHFSPRWAVHPEAAAHAGSNHRVLRAALAVLEAAASVLKRFASSNDPAADVKRVAVPPLITDVAYAYRACCWLYATASTQLKRPMTDDLDAAHHGTRNAFRAVAEEPDVVALVPPNVMLNLDENPPRNFETTVRKKNEKRPRRKKVETVTMDQFEENTESNSQAQNTMSVTAQENGAAEAEDTEQNGDTRRTVEKRRKSLKKDYEKDDLPREREKARDEDGESGRHRKKGSSRNEKRRDEDEPVASEDKRGKKKSGDRKPKATPKRKVPVVVPAPNGRSGGVKKEDREGSQEALAAAARGMKTPAINSSFEVAPYEVQFGQQIGSGGFGVVYKARFRGQTVAVKKIHAHALRNATSVAEFQSEVAVLCTLKHPNILAFYGACIRPPNLMIITEFMANGTLFDVLHQSQKRITWPMRRRLALDTCRGMRYLHDSKLLHRDLKSSNLMLDETFTCKVGDFGLTRTSSGANAVQMTGQCGTFQYMAVEVLANRPYSEKADVFSFGILMWEMVARKLPYFGMQPMQVGIAVVQQGLRPTMPPKTPVPLDRVIRACWDTDPAKRPSFAQLVDMLEAMPE